MKKTIRFAVLFSLISTALFAEIPESNISQHTPLKDAVSFSPLSPGKALDVKIENKAPGKAIVFIYDKYGNQLLMDILSAGEPTEKIYLFNKLDNGDYIVDVISNKHEARKIICVCDENITIRE
ncbi:MAG: hypothetical protein JST19_14315 [Bacteroidetes bacterium]|nr:hypothetical protein [Bacteroidota bacterium]